MKLLFWNLYDKENSKYITELLSTKSADIAIFSEYKSLSFDMVMSKNTGYSFECGFGGNDKLIALKKDNVDIKVKREQSRYTLYEVCVDKNSIILAGVHLQANPNTSNIQHAITLSELVEDIKSLEKEVNAEDTVVIGDFNANPFSPEMISKRGLNAVLFRDLIDSQEVVKSDGKYSRRFYNPTLTMLSEDNKTYGSYYYSSGAEPLYWNLYDQVVVRKRLAHSVVELEYCKRAGEYELITKKGLPNKSISDHLPLYVEIMI